jgi:hypothetical protein
MQRAEVRASIEFRGLICGCPDHQWLVVDALWEMQATQLITPKRWVVSSCDPHRAHVADGGDRFFVEDRQTGWTASAPTATALAQHIRIRFATASRPFADTDLVHALRRVSHS